MSSKQFQAGKPIEARRLVHKPHIDLKKNQEEGDKRPFAPQLPPLSQRVTQSPQSITPAEAAVLQRTVGNQALGRMLRVQRQEDEDELQMKPSSTMMGGEISSGIEAGIQRAKGGGRPLSPNIQSSMEHAFGDGQINADFSGVKVHTDNQSNQLNKSIQARAFTTGRDIFFRDGEYNPDNSSGQKLLAHELTHVVQQNGGIAQRTSATKNIQRKKIPPPIPEKTYKNRPLTDQDKIDIGISKELYEALPETAREKIESQFVAHPDAAKMETTIAVRDVLGISIGLWASLDNQDDILKTNSVHAAQQTAVVELGINADLWNSFTNIDNKTIFEQASIGEAKQKAREALWNILNYDLGLTENQFQRIGRIGQDKILSEAVDKDDAKTKILGTTNGVDGAKATRQETGSARVVAVTHLRKSIKHSDSDYRLEAKRVGPKIKAGKTVTLYNKFALIDGQEWQLAKYSWVVKKLGWNLKRTSKEKEVEGFVRLSKVMKAGMMPELTIGQKGVLGKHKGQSVGEQVYSGVEQVSTGVGRVGEAIDIGTGKKTLGKAGKGIKEFLKFQKVQWGAKNNIKDDELDEKWDKALQKQGIKSPHDGSLDIAKIFDIIGSGGEFFGGASGALFGVIGMVGGIKNAKKAGSNADTWGKILVGTKIADDGAKIASGVGKMATGVGGAITKVKGWELATKIVGTVAAGLGALKSGWDTGVGVLKSIILIAKQIKKKKGDGAAIAVQAMGVLKSALGTILGTAKTVKSVLKMTITLADAFGPIFSLVSAVINLMSAGLSVIIETVYIVKQAIMLAKSKRREKQLREEHDSNPSKHLRHLITINAKRVYRMGWLITQRASVIASELLSGVASIVTIIANIVGLATSPTGFGAAGAAVVTTVSNLTGGLIKGVTKLGGNLIKGAWKGILSIRQFGRDKGWKGHDQSKSSANKHEKRVQTVIAIMREVEDITANEGDCKKAQLLLESTGADLPTLFAQNGQPLKQAKMLMTAMQQRDAVA